jgi:hypothetical protein
MQDAAVPPADASGTVTFDGRSGTRVYFQSTDGTLIAMQDTDAAGQASATVPEGGSVTAVFTDDTATRVYSYLHVHPGDVLRAEYDTDAERVNFTVTFPVDPTAGVVGYRVNSPCYIIYNIPEVTDTPTLTTGGALGCHDTTTELLVRSVDSDDVTINTLYMQDVPISDTTTFDMTGATWTPTVTRTAQLTGLPASATTRVNLAIVSPHGMIEYPTQVVDPTSEAVFAGATFAGAIDSYRVLSTNGSSIKSLVAWAPSAATASVDDSGQMPWVTSGSYDATTGALAWTEDSTGTTATPNLVTAVIRVNRTSTASSWEWNVVAPYIGPSLPLPTLPAEASDYILQSGDDVQLRAIRIARSAHGHEDVAANPFYTYSDRTQLEQPGHIDIAGWFGP